jgi:hypothetical protein
MREVSAKDGHVRLHRGVPRADQFAGSERSDETAMATATSASRRILTATNAGAPLLESSFRKIQEFHGASETSALTKNGKANRTGKQPESVSKSRFEEDQNTRAEEDERTQCGAKAKNAAPARDKGIRNYQECADAHCSAEEDDHR